jgi:hypothetical protein
MSNLILFFEMNQAELSTMLKKEDFNLSSTTYQLRASFEGGSTIVMTKHHRNQKLPKATLIGLGCAAPN